MISTASGEYARPPAPSRTCSGSSGTWEIAFQNWGEDRTSEDGAFPDIEPVAREHGNDDEHDFVGDDHEFVGDDDRYLEDDEDSRSDKRAWDLALRSWGHAGTANEDAFEDILGVLLPAD